MASQLVTVDEAGQLLGVSRSTVWRLIGRGELRSVRRAGRRLVAVAALSRTRRGRAAAPPALTDDHPIFRLAGAGRGGGKRPGARDKHAIID